MKKIVKNNLITLLFLLLVLCFISCRGKKPNNPTGDSATSDSVTDISVTDVSGTGGNAKFDWIDVSKILSAYFDDGSTVTIVVAPTGSGAGVITVTLIPGDAVTLNYDTLMIDGASTEFSDPTVLQYQYVKFSGNEDNLPETAGNWYVNITNSSNPNVLFSFTIPEEYTTKLLAALQ